MAVLNSPKTSYNPETLLKKLAAEYPDVILKPGKVFLWSPKQHVVSYIPDQLTSDKGSWSLLHEVSHAILGHRDYRNDFELLQLEVAAWEEALAVGERLSIKIDQNFIEDCLDTYRDWLHQRSTCPTCGSSGLQHDPKTYRCHNCLTIWHVSQSRFCRPYRKKLHTSVTKEKSPDQNDQTIFN